MTAILSNRVSLFSTHNTWPDFRIERCELPPMHLEHTVSNHVLTFNVGKPLELAWRSHGSWRKGICEPGAVLGLLSHRDKQEVQWNQTCSFLELSFTPQFVDTLLETENIRFTEQRNVNDAFLKEISIALCSEAQNGPLFEKMYVESLSIACVIHLTTHYLAGSKKIIAPKGKLSSQHLKTVTDFVKSNIQNEVSLASMASSVHLSAFHFARLFKETVGLSPHQFVLHLKIGHAKKMLKQKSGSITDVAYWLNFTDQAHFCNTFKKIAGMSPRHYASL